MIFVFLPVMAFVMLLLYWRPRTTTSASVFFLHPARGDVPDPDLELLLSQLIGLGCRATSAADG